MAHAVKPRLVILVVAFATLIAVNAACGGEPDPAPTATPPPPTATPSPTPEPTPTPTPAPPPPTATPSPTPEPTPTPTPTPTPAPSPTPDMAQSTLSMRDFVIDESSTGKDLMDRLSTEETDCIRAAFGETLYGIILAVPLLQSGTSQGAAPLIGCMESENVVLFVVAANDAFAGGRSEDTRRCITDLSLQHPENAYIQMGVEWEGEETTSTSKRHEFILAYWDCLTDAESFRLGLQAYAAIDSTSSLTGADLVAVLPDAEEACMREILSEQQMNTLLTAKPLDGVRAAATAADCLSPATIASLYVASIEGVLGELTAESADCIANYAVENAEFLPLLSSDPDAMEALPPAALRIIAEGTRAVFSCYTEDELVRAQELTLAAMAAQASR